MTHSPQSCLLTWERLLLWPFLLTNSPVWPRSLGNRFHHSVTGNPYFLQHANNRTRIWNQTDWDPNPVQTVTLCYLRQLALPVRIMSVYKSFSEDNIEDP